MSEVIVVAIIASLPGTIAALATLILAFKNGRKMDEVVKATDGIKDALVEATRGEATAIGKAQGIAGERARADDVAAAIAAALPAAPAAVVKIDDSTPIKTQVVKP